MPDLNPTWDSAIELFVDEIESAKNPELYWPIHVADFLKIASSVARMEPRFLVQRDFPNKLKRQFERLIELARIGLAVGVQDESADEFRSESARLGELSFIVEMVKELVPELRGKIAKLPARLTTAAQKAARRAESLEESSWEPESQGPSGDEEEVQRLFDDL